MPSKKLEETTRLILLPDEGPPSYDPTNVGRLSKYTRTSKDGPAPERTIHKEQVKDFLRQPFDPWDGMTEQAWKAGAARTADAFAQREAARQREQFGTLGHDEAFASFDRDVKETHGVVAGDERVPVILIREELPGDDGIRLDDTAEVVSVDYAPPYVNVQPVVPLIRIAQEVVTEAQIRVQEDEEVERDVSHVEDIKARLRR